MFAIKQSRTTLGLGSGLGVRVTDCLGILLVCLVVQTKSLMHTEYCHVPRLGVGVAVPYIIGCGGKASVHPGTIGKWSLLVCGSNMDHLSMHAH